MLEVWYKYKGKKPLTEAEQILFTTAKDYLKGVMNGKTTIPTKAWKEEYTKLTAERKTLNQRYLALKEEVKEQFVFLTSGYEDEKRELTKRAAELKKEIDTAAERSADVKRFVALVRRYTEISELTYENVHEFIDRILVYELDKNTNTRKIEIFYSFVGKVDTGEQPTESVSYFRQIGADVKSVVV